MNYCKALRTIKCLSTGKQLFDEQFKTLQVIDYQQSYLCCLRTMRTHRVAIGIIIVIGLELLIGGASP